MHDTLLLCVDLCVCKYEEYIEYKNYIDYHEYSTYYWELSSALWFEVYVEKCMHLNFQYVF